MQAHGSVLPLSSNYLGHGVLSFRRDAEYLMSSYSLTSFGGWSHISWSH